MSRETMKASICFHCTSCRDKLDDKLLENVQLEIKDNPDLTCKVESSRVIIEGCFRTDEGEERFITGKMVCIHWKHSSSFLTKNKNVLSNTTVMIQVDTPKNHLITLHCNFKEKRVIFLDSFQCTNGLEMYPELALELEHLMEDMNITLIPVTIQNEIDEGFFHSVMNSLTVETSNSTTFDMYLKEVNTLQRILKTNLEKREARKYQNINRHNDLKKNIKERIKRGIEIDETLEAIKDSVKTEYPQLTRDSEVYVELQYAKRVADTFLYLLPNHLKTQCSRYRMLWFQVQTISEIKDIKEPFNTIPNYEQLQKCADLFDLKAKLRFFRSFYDVCRSYSTFANEIEIDEKNFLKELQNHLVKIAFNMKSASEELSQYLQDSMKKSDDKKRPKYLLKKLTETKHESLLEIRCMAQKLLDSHSESFVQSVERLIKKFDEKVVTNFVTESDMDIFRCEGSFVDLEKINNQIKSNPQSFDKCTKIEIQADLYFCVNSSVKWQGKNVIIVTDTLIVDERQKHYTLDVSGKDGLFTERKALDGTKSDRDGLAGEPGMHGESGGNVQIIAKKFKNPNNMCVISNGGNGSNGQDGGAGVDGIDGKDGEGISEMDFNRRFPDVAYLYGGTVGTNLNAFRNENTFISKSEEMPAGSFSDGFPTIIGSYYMKGETHDHHLVEYGFWSSRNPFVAIGAMFGAAARESYCICSGQPGTCGKAGGDGGKGGAGGKGGFEGTIDVRYWDGIKIDSVKTSGQSGQSGSDGKDGKGGKGGKNGKQGNDMAHVCPSQAQSTRVFTGHLRICSFDETSRERAFCPKRKTYIDIVKKASEYPTLQRCKDGEKGTNTRRVNNRLIESARTKKSPIVFQKIKERYQHIFCALDDGKGLQFNVETNVTLIEALTSKYSSKHERKVIKNAWKHDFQKVVQRNHLAPVRIANKGPQFKDTHSPMFQRNCHSDESIMNRVEEILAVKKDKKERNFTKKEISTTFDILDQISLHNSFNEKHYVQLLELIGLMRNSCVNLDMKENKKINYWHDKIITNFRFFILEKANGMTKLYIEGKKMEMDFNDPCSKTIMNDLQLGLKTLFEHLILNVFESDDVSHLKSIQPSVHTKLDDLMQEITICRRSVSIFGENAQMYFDKDESSKDNMVTEKPVHCPTLGQKDVLKSVCEQSKWTQETKIDIDYQNDPDLVKGTSCKIEPENMSNTKIEFQINSGAELGTQSTFESENKPEIEKQKQNETNVEIGKASKHELVLTIESDHQEDFVSSDNDTMLDDFHLETECESDLNALIDWLSNAEVCSILKKLRYLQSENVSMILKCLRYRLINQSCQIPDEFLKWFLMSLYENEECIDNGVYLRLVAATKPENWIFEWIIQEIMCHSDIKDELLCRELLNKVHVQKAHLFLCRYLSKLEEGEILTRSTVEVMMENLQTLNPDIEDNFLVALENINIFEWAYTIKWNENITALENLSLTWEDDSIFVDAAYYSSQIINRNGQEFVDKIYQCVQTYHVNTDIFLSALKRMYAGSLTISIKDLCEVKSLADAMAIFKDQSIPQGTRTVENIFSIIKTDSALVEYVTKIESILKQIDERSAKPSTLLAQTPEEDEGKNQYTTKIISMFCENDIKLWSKVCKQTLSTNSQHFSTIFIEMVTVIERSITLRRGFGLRNTQKISIIAFHLDFDEGDESYKGILQQMSTGEGKTIVIVVLSILKALQGEKVDIITSSSVLAKRDSEINKDIFALFQISVSNNCSEDKLDRQDAYSSLIVYGEIGTFQRDILLTEFYDENIIGGRIRKNVVVDEVDSMLLDRGENLLYLSHEISGIETIEFVYTFIWTLVHSKDDMIGTERDRKTVRRGMIDAMYGLVSIEDISKCSPLENSINVSQIWKILQKENIIDDEGRLLTRSFKRFAKLESNETSDVCDPGYLINMLNDTVRKGILVEVPTFLESFIYRHLDSWISNAFNAKYMEEGKHFIIDIDRTENGRGKDVNIVIMDVDTGTEQYHMQWNSGLHQFLQLKYKCAISAESLKAVFMSNISFFRSYNNLYGLTGTLGSQKERDLLKNMYNVRYIKIPTFQVTRFVEYDTILCKSANNWMKSITETAVSISKSRPVLVICDTINSCDEIEKIFRRNEVKAHVYKNSYCELSILETEKELKRGCIILATNLAGRGTDIRISEDISVIGGLHVILTYLPSNLRIEEQAFGRAARKGQYGSGQLIICDRMGRQHITREQFTISRMKIQRDITENERISKIQQRYDTFIRAEEKLFRRFQKYYDKFKKLIAKKTDTEFQKVLLQALLDLWAFWLDTVETSLESSKNFSSVMDSLDEFFEDIDNSGVFEDSNKMINLLQSPSHLVKAGKAKVLTGDHDEAQKFFNKVIVNDPPFCECALYYKVHCLLKKGGRTDGDYEIVRNTLGNCKRLIQQRIENLRNAVQAINVISSQYANKRETLTMSNGFVKQKNNAVQIYYQILDSINSITGYPIEPFMFVDATCSQIDANMIVNDLYTMKILSPQRVRIFPPEKNAWLSVKKSYKLYSKEIHSRLKQLRDKDRVTAQDFQDIIPSREELWKLLIDQGVLKDQINCILLDITELQRCCDTLLQPIAEILKSLTDTSSMNDIREYIFLYPDQKDKILAKKTKIIPIEIFKKLGFGKIFEVLEREAIVSSCSFARLATDAKHTVLSRKLPKFDQVKLDSFVELDVPIETSQAIFAQLVDSEIVARNGKLLTFELGSMWLTLYTKYSSDVRNIIQKCSKYRICALYLLRELEFPLDLFSHPHKTLFGDLVETEIVTSLKVKAGMTEEEISKQLKSLYGYDNDNKTNKLSSRIDELQHVSEQPTILSSEIDDLCRENCFSGFELEKELIAKKICVKENKKDILKLVLKYDELKKTSLKKEISHFEHEIKCFISSRLQNYLNRSGIEAQLNKWKEGLAKFENVDSELRSLADSFMEEQLIGLCDEILSITNSGFGELIVLTERKWTFKSISKMICILAIGLTQIGIAIAIEFFSIGAGTFFANVLLSEGIGDIMFAVECMISGHCTLQSYVQHKVLSMSLSVTTAGIGALFARGAQYSRFGYKIGGQFLQKKSAMELMKQGVSKRLLAKAAAKRVGKKLVEISSMKLVDAGVDFAIEKALLATLDKLCDAITDNTFKLPQEAMKSLTESMNILAKLYGKDDAKQIADNSIRNSSLDESCISIVLNKFDQLANALQNNLSEAMKKLEFCGDSRVQLVSKIVNIVSKTKNGLNVLNAVKEVVSMKTRILEKFEKNIRRRSMFRDQKDRTAKENDDCYSWSCDQINTVVIKANSEVSKYLKMQLENIVIKPILQKIGCKVQKQISKGVSEIYRYGNKCMHQKDFRKMKAEFENERQPTVSDIKDHIKLQYSKKLLNLLKRTRSPSLFADIVEEGIPLGIHSVQAISEITGAIIEIETFGGDAVTMPQRFSPTRMCLKGPCLITLQFYINPDTGIGHFKSPRSTDGNTKTYDCLLTAVLQETGILFDRRSIADKIKTNHKIRERIKSGLHEHFIIKGGTGGVKSNRRCLTLNDVLNRYLKIQELQSQLKLLEAEKNEKTKQEVDLRNENDIDAVKSEITKLRKFFSSLRDPAKKTHNSAKGTGNDEIIQISMLTETIIPSCEPGNKQFIKPTTIKIGNQKEEIDYLKVFSFCRLDTRYVIFMHEKELHGHAGALYDTKKGEHPNAGGLMKGQANFHKIRQKLILDNFDNHLLGILAGLYGHLNQLPTKIDLLETKLENRYSATGLDLDNVTERDKFFVGFEREKFKICSAAKHLISSNENIFIGGPDTLRLRFEKFKENFMNLEKTIDVDNKYKKQIQKEVNNANSFKSFGDILRDPARFYTTKHQ